MSDKPAPQRPAASLEDIDAQIAALQAKRAEIEASERAKAMAGNAKRGVALLAAMRAAYADLEELFPGTFGDEKFAVLATAQAWPRDVRIRRMADMSESETEAAREAGRKAVAGIGG